MGSGLNVVVDMVVRAVGLPVVVRAVVILIGGLPVVRIVVVIGCCVGFGFGLSR